MVVVRGMPRHMRGEIIYCPHVVGPNGEPGTFRYEYQPSHSWPIEWVARSHELIAASMPFLRNNLVYYPMPGVITLERQTPLSHVNLRAMQDGVPNAYIGNALDDPVIAGLVDKSVRFEVTAAPGGTYSIAEATADEVASHHAGRPPAAPQTPVRDLSPTEYRDLDEVEFGDADAFGAKATNLVVLRTLDLEDVRCRTGTRIDGDGTAAPRGAAEGGTAPWGRWKRRREETSCGRRRKGMTGSTVQGVATGLALTLAAGQVAAVDLDDPESGPLYFAAESASAEAVTVTGTATDRTTYYNIEMPDGDAALTTRNEIRLAGSETWYVRADVEGMVFSATPELSATGEDDSTGFAGTDAEVVFGRAGTSSIVYELPGGDDLPSGLTFSLSIRDALAVPAGEGAYGAEMSLYENLGDAIRQVRSYSGLFGGEKTVVVMTSGLDVGVESGIAVADGGKGFTAFTPDSASSGSTDPDAPSAVLGSIAVVARDRGPDGKPRIVYAARGGRPATLDDLIESVSVTIEGEMSFGTFELRTGAGADRCRSTAGGGTIALSPPLGEETVTTVGKATVAQATEPFGTRHLCVRLRAPKAGETPPQIPIGVYQATVAVAPVHGGDDAVSTGVVGDIRRSGARVEIAYLTVSQGYDERLVIVNRSRLPVRYVFTSFQPETGATAKLTPEAATREAGGSNVVGARSQVTLPTHATLAIARSAATTATPMTAATLSLNAHHKDIDVVTIRTNSADGSTDTTVYPARATLDPEER